eukprot:gene7566-9301_t
MTKKEQEQSMQNMNKGVEETTSTNVDTSKLKLLNETTAAPPALTPQQQRQKELAAVKVEKTDIALIVDEFEITPEQAELALRENKVNAIFYLPGMFPKYFKPNDAVYLKVNKITSTHTQIPYKYYSLPVCKPDPIIDENDNLGEFLLGDRIENSIYNITFTISDEFGPCKVLNYYAPKCDPWLGKNDLKLLSERIKYEYKVQWLLDGLPVRQQSASATDPGFLLGFPGWKSTRDNVNKDKDYVNNHVDIIVYYHGEGVDENGNGGYLIVGFEVAPDSRGYKPDSWKQGDENKCPELIDENFPQTVTSDKEFVLWTYSVKFEKSPTLWSKRWDVYLASGEKSIHWFSILNSLMIVLILSIMVAMIMMRTITADFRRYNALDSDEAEETGWKMIHGDVFRPPTRPMLLSVLVGSGIQVFLMSLVTMIFAVLGFLSPANIGGLATSLVVLFIIMAMFAGFFSTRVYLAFKGKNWKKNTLYTAFGFPGTIFLIFLFVNIFLRGSGSSAAVPFKTFISIISMWFGISVPLVFCGSYYAIKKPVPEDPVRTNQIPKPIPTHVWYMNPYLSVLMGGILPFGAVFIELYFILTAIWDNQFYYIFGFLFLVMIILVVTSAEISIVMCYFQLCAEDHHWWWRSFLTSGSSALYMFLYSIFFFRHLSISKPVSVLLYFSYSLIMALCFFVLTGAIGFYACYKLVRKIYSSIHIN